MTKNSDYLVIRPNNSNGVTLDTNHVIVVALDSAFEKALESNKGCGKCFIKYIDIQNMSKYINGNIFDGVFTKTQIGGFAMEVTTFTKSLTKAKVLKDDVDLIIHLTDATNETSVVGTITLQDIEDSMYEEVAVFKQYTKMIKKKVKRTTSDSDIKSNLTNEDLEAFNQAELSEDNYATSIIRGGIR